MSAISDYDLGWLVGILEGEGCFHLDKRPGNGGSPKVQVKMTDEDTINRYASLCEQILQKPVSIYTVKTYSKKDSIPYSVQLSGDSARTIMRLVVKRMSWRRRQKIWQILNGFKPAKNGLSTNDILKLVANNG